MGLRNRGVSIVHHPDRSSPLVISTIEQYGDPGASTEKEDALFLAHKRRRVLTAAFE